MSDQPRQVGGGRSAIGDVAPRPKAMTAISVAREVFDG
jgi:hypothetical protein